MSAWICSDNHISAIVAWWRNYIKEHPTYQCDWSIDSEVIGTMLVAQNYRSVYERYHDRAEGYFGLPQSFKYEPAFEKKPVNSIVLLKLLRCYDYQACETDDWKDSKAKEFTEMLADAAISKLTGREGISYEFAPWGIDSLDWKKEIEEKVQHIKRVRAEYARRRRKGA